MVRCPVSNSEASINNSQTSGSDKQTWSDRIQKRKICRWKGKFYCLAWRLSLLYYGQRRGLGIHLNRPVFVKEIDPEKNEVMLASLSSLEKTEMWLKDWNLVNQERTFRSLWHNCEDTLSQAGKPWHDYRHIGSFIARAASWTINSHCSRTGCCVLWRRIATRRRNHSQRPLILHIGKMNALTQVF